MGEKHMGCGLVDFLREEGILEEAQAQALKEAAEWRRLSERDSRLVLDLLENPTTPNPGLRAAIAALPKRRD